MVLGHKYATVNTTVVGSILTRENEIYTYNKIVTDLSGTIIKKKCLFVCAFTHANLRNGLTDLNAVFTIVF